jgi:hypothetical protein
MFQPIIRPSPGETDTKYVKEGNIKKMRPLSYLKRFNFYWKWCITMPPTVVVLLAKKY